MKFDKYGNIVGDVFIRRCERKGKELTNTVIKTYPTSASSGPTTKEFLKNPVDARDYPPAKHLE